MIDINSYETVLTGQWIFRDGRLVANDVCERIFSLTTSYLVKVKQDVSGWNTLYRDPNDRRYWELTFPQSELQGGGPPQLKCVTVEEAKEKYGLA